MPGRACHCIASSAASMRGIRPTSLFAPGPPLQAACTASYHRGALSYVALVVSPMSIAIREKSYHGVRDRHPIHRCRHAADRSKHMGINKDQVAGRAKEAAGKVQEVAGKAAGNTTGEAKGKLNKAAGAAQATFGDARKDVKDTLKRR